MEHDSNYVKDVEKYFLSLAGEGIMLSSMDYSLIMEWKNMEIPKEVIFKGINKAFEKAKSRQGQGSKLLRNIKQCRESIENSIEEYRPIIGLDLDKTEDLETVTNFDMVLERVNGFIKSEKEDILKNYYLNMKEKLLSQIKSGGENVLSISAQIEEECIHDFFESLSESEKNDILLEARGKLGNRSRHMTDAALLESTASFRNEILANNYGLKSLHMSSEDNNG